MNNNPPINSNTQNSGADNSDTKFSGGSTHGNSSFGSGYFARIIADATRKLKINHNINSDQNLIDSLEQNNEQLNPEQENSTQLNTNNKTSAEPSLNSALNAINAADTSNKSHIKTTQDTTQKISNPLQARTPSNKNTALIIKKTNDGNNFSKSDTKHQSAPELPQKNIYKQAQSDAITTQPSHRNDADTNPTPFAKENDSYANKNKLTNTSNLNDESFDSKQRAVSEITKPLTTKNSAQRLTNHVDHLSRQDAQNELHPQKITAHKPTQNLHAASIKKTVTPQPKLHIGEVNIKVIDSAQGPHDKIAGTRAVQKTVATAATSKSAESRTFLRTL